MPIDCAGGPEACQCPGHWQERPTGRTTEARVAWTPTTDSESPPAEAEAGSTSLVVRMVP
jgi:hypothetical protein